MSLRTTADLRTKCLRGAENGRFSATFFFLEIKPKMRDVLAKMRDCGKQCKLRDFPHVCETVDTYAVNISQIISREIKAM